MAWLRILCGLRFRDGSNSKLSRFFPVRLPNGIAFVRFLDMRCLPHQVHGSDVISYRWPLSLSTSAAIESPTQFPVFFERPDYQGSDDEHHYEGSDEGQSCSNESQGILDEAMNGLATVAEIVVLKALNFAFRK